MMMVTVCMVWDGVQMVRVRVLTSSEDCLSAVREASTSCMYSQGLNIVN